MKDFKKYLIGFLVACLCFVLLLYCVDIPEYIIYDCRMLIGGWHPDVPVEIINQCRKQGTTV
jgi:hypothetical protein